MHCYRKSIRDQLREQRACDINCHGGSLSLFSNRCRESRQQCLKRKEKENGTLPEFVNRVVKKIGRDASVCLRLVQENHIRTNQNRNCS